MTWRDLSHEQGGSEEAVVGDLAAVIRSVAEEWVMSYDRWILVSTYDFRYFSILVW